MADEENTSPPAEEAKPEPEKAPVAKERAPARAANGTVAASAGHAVVVARPAAVGPALPQVSRRAVLKTGFWAGMGVMLAAIGTTIVYSLYPRKTAANGGQQLLGTSEVSPFGGVITIGPLDQLAVGQKIQNLDARTWLVRLDATQAAHNPPAVEGSILALYQKCPHLGCTVPWRPGFTREDPRNGETYPGWFLCPCHGSTYSDAGVRVFGPAPHSMDTFAVSIQNGKIVVDTSKITTGGVDNASRAILPS